MRVYNKEEFENNEHSLLKELKQALFIYPTDSIYGIGCDATNKELVQKIREAKNSSLQPFSVIAPNKEWIYENCEVSDEAKEWVEKLGTRPEIDGERQAISVILKLNNPDAVATNVLQGRDHISIRLPEHWFTEFVSKLDVPIVTTSANPTGGDFMTSLDDLHERVQTAVDICIYEGELKGSPSTLVFCNEEEVCIKRR